MLSTISKLNDVIKTKWEVLKTLLWVTYPDEQNPSRIRTSISYGNVASFAPVIPTPSSIHYRISGIPRVKQHKHMN